MRMYFYLFFNLLLPITILFIILAIIYFNLNYTFTQAVKLGVLNGVIISVPFSTLVTIVLLIMRLGKKQIIHNKKYPHTKFTHDKENNKILSTQQKNQNNIEIQTMLLMDKELAFDVILAAIEEENIGTLKKSSLKNGFIQIIEDTLNIKIHIDTLTRHTAAVTIQSNFPTYKTSEILTYLKNKENFFLIY